MTAAYVLRCPHADYFWIKQHDDYFKIGGYSEEQPTLTTDLGVWFKARNYYYELKKTSDYMFNLMMLRLYVPKKGWVDVVRGTKIPHGRYEVVKRQLTVYGTKYTLRNVHGFLKKNISANNCEAVMELNPDVVKSVHPEHQAMVRQMLQWYKGNIEDKFLESWSVFRDALNEIGEHMLMTDLIDYYREHHCLLRIFDGEEVHPCTVAG